MATAKATEGTREIEILPLDQYDHFIVSFSGGKDSLCCVLWLLEAIGPENRHKVELWHQHVDGEPGQAENFQDWPVTEAYCRAVADALELPIRSQWREGGFEGEMCRNGARTGDVRFEDGTGNVVHLPTKPDAPLGTRELYPQVCGDLSKRWCSASLKIDVAARALNNDPRFVGKRTLFVTGERAQESANRAKYPRAELHRCHANKRLVHHYRPIHGWSEEQVWETIRRHRFRPHPAYYLGFGRVSCMKCIFHDADGWATVRELDGPGFDKIAGYEVRWGKTIHRKLSVIQQADAGTSTIRTGPEIERQRQLAMGREYPAELVAVSDEEEWTMPAGAFRRCGGPT